LKFAVRRTARLKRDIKKLMRGGKDIEKLLRTVEMFAEGQTLPPEYKDHPLTGEYKGKRGCHIELVIVSHNLQLKEGSHHE
jgi:mRNA interferase YafQ